MSVHMVLSLRHIRMFPGLHTFARRMYGYRNPGMYRFPKLRFHVALWHTLQYKLSCCNRYSNENKRGDVRLHSIVLQMNDYMALLSRHIHTYRVKYTIAHYTYVTHNPGMCRFPKLQCHAVLLHILPYRLALRNRCNNENKDVDA